MILAFFIFAAFGSLFLESPWDYFDYEPLTEDELAEESAWLANEREQDAAFLLEEDEAWARAQERYL